MRNGYRYILYLLLALAILGGLALFVFRLAAAGYLRERSGLQAASEIKVTVKPEALNTDIFQNPSFTALKNNVINFNFDRICSQPLSAPAPVLVASPADTSTASGVTPPQGCVQGSGLPFAAPVKKNN